MRMPTLFAVAVLISAAVAQEQTSQEQPGTPADKVKALQTERIATLKVVAEMSQKLAAIARLDVREALEDKMTLLKAELDAAETDSERAVLRSQVLESLKALEEVARSRKENALGTEVDVLRVKARRLELEMQIEQAKLDKP